MSETVDSAQPAIICSNITIETLEQGVKYVQNSQCRRSIYLLNVNNRNNRTRRETCSKFTMPSFYLPSQSQQQKH